VRDRLRGGDSGLAGAAGVVMQGIGQTEKRARPGDATRRASLTRTGIPSRHGSPRDKDGS
jgi:hypothetical protein